MRKSFENKVATAALLAAPILTSGCIRTLHMDSDPFNAIEETRQAITDGTVFFLPCRDMTFSPLQIPREGPIDQLPLPGESILVEVVCDNTLEEYKKALSEERFNEMLDSMFQKVNTAYNYRALASSREHLRPDSTVSSIAIGECKNPTVTTSKISRPRKQKTIVRKDVYCSELVIGSNHARRELMPSVRPDNPLQEDIDIIIKNAAFSGEKFPNNFLRFESSSEEKLK
jgi:hypothetical protein